MRYCVCFLFTEDFNDVLLMKKNRTGFKGMLNGVGGKQEPNESDRDCAIREIHEETGCYVFDSLRHIASTDLHVDCAVHGSSECHLDFWMAIVDKDEPKQQPNETEELVWVPVKEVLSTAIRNNRFAGDGDVQYMINLALRMYGNTAE